MRVADSLERGLSLFMASLMRLERIVRAAREAPQARPVCYLLDEVLQGTNSAERRVAVRTIVDHLRASWAIGVVTTHDLDLARDHAFAARADSVHLQETLTGTGDAVTMTFDYRLRPGAATGGNALQLLRLLGLDRASQDPVPAGSAGAPTASRT
jgi:DNA mismatch repair ATPase MutS